MLNTVPRGILYPVLVGALLVVALNFRTRQRRDNVDGPTYIDRNDGDVVRLKGPLQIRMNTQLTYHACRYTFWVSSRFGISRGSGAT